MTSFHANSIPASGLTPWQPIGVPARGQDRTAFHAFVLLPGLSVSFLATTLGRSRSSVSAYRRAALAAARSDPAVAETVEAAVWAMRAEHGLQMARLRGRSQLPSWSRLAMGEFRKSGWTLKRIASAFRCSTSTVNNVLQGKGSTFAPFSQTRILTEAQQNPPNKFRGANAPIARQRCSAHEHTHASIPPLL